MKKMSGIVAVLALTAAILTGCQAKKNAVIDVTALANDLKSSVTFADTLEEPSDSAFSRIYTIENADVAAKKVYVSSGATAEEIAVFEATDDAAAKRIRSAVDTRIADNLDGFKDYNPEEQKKLNDPVIVETGKYIILCVSNDNAAAQKCIEKYTK